MRTRVVAVAALLLTGCGGGTSPEGACAGPMVTLSSGTVAAGGEVRVRSGGLWSDCYDTGQQGTPPPSEDVAVQFQPQGSSTSVELATVDADEEGRIDVSVTIPAGTPAGPAEVVILGSSATVVVTAP
jgi:hypothetical protein